MHAIDTYNTCALYNNDYWYHEKFYRGYLSISISSMPDYIKLVIYYVSNCRLVANQQHVH